MNMKFKKGLIMALVALQLVFVLTACGNGLKVDPTKNADKDYVGSTEKDDYKYDVYKDYVKITEYIGKDEVVIVPSELEEKEVKEIEEQAFKDKEGRNIKEVVLPNTITTMTQYSFNKLTTLEKISFNGQNPNFVYEDGIIYSKDMKQIITYPSKLSKKEYKIPDTVTEISDSQFSNLTELEKITIPKSVKYIGNWAFKNCSHIKSITLPKSVDSIGMAIFMGCADLKELTCPNKDINGLTTAGIMSAKLKTIKGYSGTNAEKLAKELDVKFVDLKD